MSNVETRPRLPSHQVNPGGFVDPNLPDDYAPFRIRNFNSEIFVTYAKQDRHKHDDVPGPGFGFVNVFDTSGNFSRRLVSNGNPMLHGDLLR